MTDDLKITKVCKQCEEDRLIEWSENPSNKQPFMGRFLDALLSPNKMKRIWGWIKIKWLKLLIGIGIVGVASATYFGAPVATPEPIKEHTYFAELDNNDVVLRVIVASPEFINSGRVGNPANWKEAYKDGRKKKNFPSKGFTYDKVKDVYRAPKPTVDAVLDPITEKWSVPNFTMEK